MKIRISFFFILFVVIIFFLISLFLPFKPDVEILLNLRLPRSLAIVLSGFLLATAGFISQRITSNPLADPFVIGTSSGAMLGVIISQLTDIRFYSFYYFIVINSITLAIVYLSWWLSIYFVKTESILLTGIAVNSFVLSLIVYYVIFSRENSISFFHLSFGSFSYVEWNSLLYSFISFVISFFILSLIWKDLKIIAFNIEKSITLGVSERLIRFFSFTIISLLTSASVSLSGIIGFVGLMSSHIAYHLNQKREDFYSFVMSGIVGSSLLLLADIFSRYFFYPLEIPPGVFTSIFGSIFFFYIIFNSRSK